MNLPPKHKVRQFLGIIIVVAGYTGMVYFTFQELNYGNEWPIDTFLFFMIIIGIGTYYVVSGAKRQRNNNNER